MNIKLKNTNFYWVLFIASLIHLSIGELVFANSEHCKSLSNPNNLLKCIQENHPDVRLSKSELEATNELESVAKQLPNPELDLGYTRGNSFGDEVTELELSLGFTLEVGGKRGARIEKAQAEKAVKTAENLKTKEEITYQAVIALYKLRQINEEVEIINEAIETFNKIQNQYKKRGNLGPEQEVALNVFELAEGDYNLKKVNFNKDRLELGTFFKLTTGRDIEEIEKALPSRKINWPEADSFSTNSEFKNSDLELAESKLKNADAELNLAKSESWPDLKISPVFKRESEAGYTFNSYGINLSVPLPLFQANGGGRYVARKTKETSELNLNLTKEKLIKHKQEHIQAYAYAVKKIKESKSLTVLQQKHSQIERLFKRGLVSSSLVIEAHRQIFDYAQHLNERELDTLQMLWTLYSFDGRVLEESL